jgi:hypothetical protein
MTGHSPTPWTAYEYGSPVGTGYIRGPNDERVFSNGNGMTIADVRFLVRAVNSHDALVAALDQFLDKYCEMVGSGDCGFWNPEEDDFVIQARAALRLARSGTP